MQRLVTAFVLLVGLMAQGSEENIRLSLVETELQGDGVSAGLQKMIRVNQDGVAYGILQGAQGEVHKVYLRVFLKKEMDDLETKISEVDNGSHTHRAAQCLALPTKRFAYHAANDSISLYEASAPCGASDRNEAPATSALINILDALQLSFQEELET
ncbi:MAG: hypothetical protein H6617_00950 [Bdellovibrionaceae bacterium]|nr:hypothetical protein [Bdellovibrionales bacterium]MCB9253234.1 hypothetical protein [Pseudobdellovibrionaceae bacterium]